MNNDKKTTHIFTGSIIEGQPLINSLNELDIHPIIIDDHQSGILSGFAAGVPGQIRMYIRNEEIIIAKSILEDFEHNFED